MALTVRLLTGGSLVVWAAALAFSAGAPVHGSAAQTTNDGIYTKAQADGAKKQFDKICAECHAFTVAAKKKPKDLTLGDEPFFESWTGRPVVDLVNVIVLTMPNDGSAVVSETEAVDLVAYMLQQNGFPAGPKPLTKDTAKAVIARPEK
jgi:mono/diheme cytochrome c family protein